MIRVSFFSRKKKEMVMIRKKRLRDLENPTIFINHDLPLGTRQQQKERRKQVSKSEAGKKRSRAEESPSGTTTSILKQSKLNFVTDRMSRVQGRSRSASCGLVKAPKKRSREQPPLKKKRSKANVCGLRREETTSALRQPSEK